MATNETLDDSINIRTSVKSKQKFLARCKKLNTNPSAMLNRMIIASNDDRLTITPTKEEKEMYHVGK